MSKLWDISPFIDENSDVFPGDSQYSQTKHFQLSAQCPVNVNTITLSPHTGAHADAPLHYANQQAAIGHVELTPYIGPCRVIECVNSNELVMPQHIEHALDHLPPRILLKTSKQASQSWSSFSAIHPQTLELIQSTLEYQKKHSSFLLIGIDTPSIDPSNSFELPCHHFLLRNNCRVLENLVLDEVSSGDYELIALPLKLRHADASPVRAILRSL